MPYNFSNVKWKDFFIGGSDGIFQINATKSGIDKNKLNLENGNIPYITRSKIDNGINFFISSNQNKKYNKDKGNVIIIGLDTQTCFYQENDFYTGQNVQILSNKKLNKKIAMFLIPLIKSQIKKLNWGGNGATLSRLNRMKILLPIDEQGAPNWIYMERFIENIEQKKINELLIWANQTQQQEHQEDEGQQTQNQKPYRDELTYQFLRLQAEKQLQEWEEERLKKEEEKSKKDIPTFKIKM
ncbi:restriction endonuclease subunit S [Mesomycoplasma ovipneumoniae]|uniref:restriction endonuclease subunit S n=1 Tax=Mesomycoplasma ovipneumoniae TaxID=29562 RepID=UPI0009BCD1C8|nr:restriction endonuclease subunit S [Mesomycoplasma ovipneumoniae]